MPWRALARSVAAPTGRRAGLGNEQDPVRLAQAEPGPRRNFRLGQVEDEIVRRLNRVEPLCGLLRGTHIQDAHARGQLRQRVGKATHEGGDGNALIEWYERESLGRPRFGDPTRRKPQPAYEQPHQLQHRLGMPFDQPLENGLSQPQQLSVAERHHGGRAWISRYERHFADGLAGRDCRHQSAAAVVALHPGAKATVSHHIERVGLITLFEQGPAAGQAKPFQFCLDGGKPVTVDALEKRQPG